MRRLLLCSLGVLLFLAAIPVHGQFQRNGTAVNTSCDCYRLTLSAGGQNGSIWNQQRIDLGNSFDYNFRVNFGCSDAGADGVVFALQTNPLATGVSGGGIGYQTISPSVAVEFDTYQNGWDPTYDHIAIVSNGDVDHTTGNNLAGPVAALASSGNIEDCLFHDVRIRWNAGSMTLEAYLDGALRLSYTGNLVANIFGGNAQVYWGFTSSTG
ncbi:MAG TPA: L-type lectin-domain containing protein, partial [Bacteroidia bacterium]|nr:L-type lectin-domain containing protein [Bacteroidia bacterium]